MNSIDPYLLRLKQESTPTELDRINAVQGIWNLRLLYSAFERLEYDGHVCCDAFIVLLTTALAEKGSSLATVMAGSSIARYHTHNNQLHIYIPDRFMPEFGPLDVLAQDPDLRTAVNHVFDDQTLSLFLRGGDDDGVDPADLLDYAFPDEW